MNNIKFSVQQNFDTDVLSFGSEKDFKNHIKENKSAFCIEITGQGDNCQPNYIIPKELYGAKKSIITIDYVLCNKKPLRIPSSVQVNIYNSNLKESNPVFSKKYYKLIIDSTIFPSVMDLKGTKILKSLQISNCDMLKTEFKSFGSGNSICFVLCSGMHGTVDVSGYKYARFDDNIDLSKVDKIIVKKFPTSQSELADMGLLYFPLSKIYQKESKNSEIAKKDGTVKILMETLNDVVAEISDLKTQMLSVSSKTKKARELQIHLELATEMHKKILKRLFLMGIAQR